MGKARQNNILEFAATRKILTAVANLCVHFNTNQEAREILGCIRDELTAIIDGDVSSTAWKQATSTLTGVDAYALERIGLLPDKTPDKTE
jgi:hypothetical protein